MKAIKAIRSCQYKISENDDEGITLHLQGRMDVSNASHMIKVLGSLLKDRVPSSLTVDLEKVTYLDDFGALVLVELKNMMTHRKGRFSVENASEDILFVLNFDALKEGGRLPRNAPRTS